MARLTLLGTGTCQLEDGRTASSALIELDDLRLVFDCGRGVAARLAELGYRQDQLPHIVISHFHADHVSDLVPLMQAGSWSRTDPRNRDRLFVTTLEQVARCPWRTFVEKVLRVEQAARVSVPKSMPETRVLSQVVMLRSSYQDSPSHPSGHSPKPK